MGTTSRLVIALGLLAIPLAGCDEGATTDDLCTTPSCMPGGCDPQKGDADCTTGLHCDPTLMKCVACVNETHCPAGQTCRAVGDSRECVPSCSPTHGCGDAGVCENDAGQCLECLADVDCHDAARPRCNPASARCVPCLPARDNCPHATYCSDQAGVFSCQPGCKTNADCLEGGGGDGGGDGDGGAPGSSVCNTTLHQCAQCLANDDCPLGKICQAGSCGDGCTEQHACAGDQSCCGGACADLAHDAAHCGACGNPCTPGYNCCGGTCSNPTGDINNCGACGGVCTVANGNPGCGRNGCSIAFCNTGWGDCNASYADGCETNTDINVNNCGACNFVCSLAHAEPRCQAGGCQVGTCIAPWVHCNGRPMDGCEVNSATDPLNCGGCGRACSANHVPMAACASGNCSGPCEAGFADCNSSKLSDGCETNVAGDVLNCGACGNACSQANGTPSCGAGKCAIACKPGFANCSGDVRTGCETATSTVNNCGGCGIVCKLNHAVSDCTSGSCKVGVCEAGWADCDGNAVNGCEVNVATDSNNCGVCARVCNKNNGTPACNGGTCSIACGAGFADCNGNPGDGCETQVASDPKSCGVCGSACAGNHIAVPVCSAASCTGSCDAGWADCNNNKRFDGCEVSVLTDVSSCGGCGTLCALAHATPACVAGACQVATCEAGWSDCDGNPANGCEVHTAVDVQHCGSCVRACPTVNGSAFCAGSVCGISCNVGFAHCTQNANDGCETNLNTNVNSCGSCGAVCNLAHATPSCSNGACAVAACAPGWTNCNALANDGCEVNTDGDVANCGTCGKRCSSNHDIPACVAGACQVTCIGGFADCNGSVADGCEANVTADASNCGACGIACSSNHVPSPSCAGGLCNGLCAPGFSDCNNNKQVDGCEVNVAGDVNNCGGCGTRCSGNHVQGGTCINGTCSGACAPGWGDCNGNLQLDGCETNVMSSLNDCGGCGLACSANHVANPSCVGGACTGACQPGWTDCNGNLQADGCEANFSSDTKSCGMCGVVCSGANMAISACMGGTCVGQCAAGFADCNGNLQADGCEVNLATSLANCGGCGAACSGAHVDGAACTGGSCTGSCAAGFADCNGNLRQDGCELNVAGDLDNCGSCGGACSNNHVAGGACTNGTCTGSCAPGFLDCNNNLRQDGCEANPASDIQSCGACGAACAGTNVLNSACVNFACTGQCVAGFADCNGNLQPDGCEANLNTSLAHCGGCGAACSGAHVTGSACTSGNCTGQCAAGFADCNANLRVDGCEIDTGTSASNCGACGTVCSGAHVNNSACAGGTCTGACAAGFANCDGDLQGNGCEVDVAGNVASCGACGRVCSGAHVDSSACVAGACTGTCTPGFGNCDVDLQSNGCEVDLESSAGNCGGCGSACSGAHVVSSACVAGTCSGACEAGFANCDNALRQNGCEVNTGDDVTNCGACGTVCSPAHVDGSACSAGLCTGSCAAGFANCNLDLQQDGCEVDLLTDKASCGDCGTVCSGQNVLASACTGGACTGTCAMGFDDCNGNLQLDGCETDLLADPSSCGGCGVVCDGGQACVAGACQ